MVEKLAKKRNIVVLGAGFAGLRAVQDLAKKLKDPSYSIILIDKKRVHIFHADLYEVAAAFHHKITEECLTQLKETVAVPIVNLIDQKKVQFINDSITAIDTNEKLVKLRKNADVHYDYLVVALGSETNYFGIPGLKEHSFALKTVNDAIKLNCHLDHQFQYLWREDKDQLVHINIGGGGATGVELAAELAGYVDRLCEKYKYPSHKVKLQLIEGSERLAGMDGKGKEIILNRFKDLGIKVYPESYITGVEEGMIHLKTPEGERNLDNNVLIWIGGVQVASVVKKSLGSKEGRGAILVNPFLQSNIDRNVFAAGDNAYFVDPISGKPLPMLAQVAYEEGALIAKNLIKSIKGEQLIILSPVEARMILPLGGKYAVFVRGQRVFKGFFVWLLRRFVYFRYALSIMPFSKALKRTFRSTKVFMEND